MKPRLVALPITPEDTLVWMLVRQRFVGYGGHLRHGSFSADRRDADLMFVAQWRWRAGYRRSRPWHPYAGPLEIFDGGQRLQLGGDIT